MSYHSQHGQLAQSVEQRTENPRVRGSIPRLPTTLLPSLTWRQFTLLLSAYGCRDLRAVALDFNLLHFFLFHDRVEIIFQPAFL